MKCKQSEKFLSKSLDDRLTPSEAKRLKAHLDNCPFCQKILAHYQTIRRILKDKNLPETKPYFWERLQPKLKEKTKVDPWPVRKQFGLRAIPLSVLFAALIAAAVLLLVPSPSEELDLSQTGVFLLQGSNPLVETQNFLSEEGEGNKHIMLIFSSLDETTNGRR